MRMRTFAAAALVAVCAMGSAAVSHARVLVSAGTPISVRLDTQISTEDATAGDAWTGTVSQDVYSNGRLVIPAGSQAEGVVTTAAQGTHTTKARLGLAVRRVTVNGRSQAISANAATIVADTNRAKKLGAVALGAVTGGLLGHTVAKDKHGTLIGSVVGGAAGYGLTRHAFRTLQLKPGTTLTFTTRTDAVAYW